MKRIMKYIVAFLLCIMVSLGTLSPIQAKNTDDYLPDNCFYLSPDEQQELYNKYIQLDLTDVYNHEVFDDGAYIIKDSIYRLYMVDCQKFADKGIIKFQPASDVGVDGKKYYYYYAKIANEFNQYIGTTCFALYEDGSQALVTIQLHDNTGISVEIRDYADYAEKISKLLGVDYIIPATDVRLVYFQMFTKGFMGFWINHKDIEMFVFWGGDIDISSEKDVAVTNERIGAKEYVSIDGIRELCIEYQKKKQEIKEKYGENSQEIEAKQDLPVVNPFYTGINEITNITEYLHLDEVNWTKKSTKKPNYVLIGGGVALAAIIVAMTTVILIKKKKVNKK